VVRVKVKWCPLDRGLGGPLSQPGCSGEEKDSASQEVHTYKL
jgi:hypothetical protein